LQLPDSGYDAALRPPIHPSIDRILLCVFLGLGMRCVPNLDAARECAALALIVPLLHPGVGTHRLVDLLEVVAGRKVLAALLLAAVKVDVRLVAVAGHVLVREPWIEGGGLQLVGGHVAAV